MKEERLFVVSDQCLIKRRVKSSSGISETRYVIGATIKAGIDVWDIELIFIIRGKFIARSGRNRKCYRKGYCRYDDFFYREKA